MDKPGGPAFSPKLPRIFSGTGPPAFCSLWVLVSPLFILSCSFVSSGQECFGGFFMVSLVSWTLSRTILHRPHVEHSLCGGLSPSLSLQITTQTGKLLSQSQPFPGGCSGWARGWANGDLRWQVKVDRHSDMLTPKKPGRSSG